MMKKMVLNLVGKFRKALPFLVTAAAAGGFVACNEDDGTEMKGLVPVNFSVETAGADSRAAVYDLRLAEGSQIGVKFNGFDSLTNQKMDFYNKAYEAVGKDASQIWVPGSGDPIYLTSSAASLAAYYPFNESVTDVTAIPVETDTQTDYMYSGIIKGVTKDNPHVKLTMQHALSLVRIALVKSESTDNMSVSAVAVQAPIFGTAGTLDAEWGRLNDITGLNQPVTVKPQVTLTADTTFVDVLVVPDINCQEGTFNLTVNLNGTEHKISVPVIEAYKQGYVYTYTVKADNEGVQLLWVNSAPWNDGVVDKNQPERDNKYIVQIAVPADNYKYRHNTRGLVGTVNWGDGNTEYFACGDTDMVSHTYEKAGEYTVTCTGIVSKIESGDKWGVSRIINKLIHIGKDCNVIGMASAFQGQELITEIPEGIFDGCDKVDFWSFAFTDCTGITEIPEGLFDKCTGATKLGNCFNGCMSLKKLPARLLPEDNKVIDLKSLFFGCVSLTEIPATLFENCTEVVECSNTFGRCTGLTSIPEGLFDNCTNVEDFEGVFDGCKALTGIPVGLFDKCTKATNFSQTFRDCEALTGESPYTTIKVDGNDVKVHLYERASYPQPFTAPTKYNDCFKGCTGLSDIAEITAAGWN